MPNSISRSEESNVAVGIALPQYGAIASPETILHVALEAEKMGLASLWVSDRLLLPTKPKDTFDGDPWPEIFATVYDPIEMLTFVAARTRKVKLGTNVLQALFQNPVTLARRFATLDRLSDGRAIAGIGQADFRDEFEAANVPIKRRGRGFEEFVNAMRAVWGPDPVSFAGDFYNIPESKIGPKPVQSEGIPLLLGAFAPASMERAARLADGILPAAGRKTTIEKLSQTINNFHDMVRRAGRNPEEMKWILRVHNPLEEKSTEPRALLGGTPQQAAKDLPRLKEIGIDHVFYDMNHPAGVPIDTQLLLLRRLMRLIKSQENSRVEKNPQA
ncbi:MAG TPA: TIGR03619 family F420-dependent LLM class oxidoreductase [Candidatus Sulfotelmatobacter sp.]|nr:TIGR03619 family F420-dependent LLM class oxidoreductase [Candidatus Sulfotelmatobacter sp.]